MSIESPAPHEQTTAPSTDAVKAQYIEAQSTPPEPGPTTHSGDVAVNGVDSANETQRHHHAVNVPNGVQSMYPYPYPPPPGAMYPISPEMYQNGMGPGGQRVMAPVPYPYPPPQPGQPGQPMPSNGYAFPGMMATPPPSSGASGASPTSPTGPMQYPPFGMWYPGMPMMPPPGMMSQNGLPVPMSATLAPNGYPQPSHSPAEGQPPQNIHENGVPPPPPQQQQQQQQQQHQSNGEPQQPNGNHPSGPGGLPPKEVAKTIPCRYFPDCRFGASCWFLHPGENAGQGPPSAHPDNRPAPPYWGGPLPPPVRYGPSGPWDGSATSPITNGAPPGDGKNNYPPPPGPNPGPYGMMYAPYPYPNGYPAPYPPPQQQGTPASGPSAPQSPPHAPQPMSPQHFAQTLNQNPPSHPHSPAVPTPPQGVPVMYSPNGVPGPWYPAPAGAFPQNVPMQHHGQPLSPQQGQGMVPLPISPVSPPVPMQSMGGASAMSPGGHPVSLQPMGPNSIPYPLSPPYTSPRMQPKSPSQVLHPLSPQAHPGSPQNLYGNQPQLPPSIPVMPPHGHHSRRESMSSMSAVPMGVALGPHIDANGPMDGTRSPPSAFREMDGGFGRRGRGGHAPRGSWSSNGFGSSRKPPCAFYPLGKCKNGDQCRFPHIMTDENSPVSPVSPRGGYTGSFGRAANGRRPTILSAIEDKMGELSVKEQTEGAEHAQNHPTGIPKPYSSSPKTRVGRAPLSTPSTPSHRTTNHLQSVQQHPSQRVPVAEDFPVLGGTATPPSGNGASYASAWGGPTAAQVLKNSINGKKPTGSSTSEGAKEVKSGVESDHGVNGTVVEAAAN